MSVTVRKLFSRAGKLYKAKLVAGASGLDGLVEWVHLFEDKDVGNFLRGGEVIFTTGLMCRDDNWLMEFTKTLCTAGASAFVINIGPYIEEIPEKIIAYCNDRELPLYTIPWETHLVDMTRYFGNIIFEDFAEELTASQLFKDIIFEGPSAENREEKLKEYGYRDSDLYTILSIGARTEKGWDGANVEMLTHYAEHEARLIRDKILSFTYDERVILVLVNFSEKEISDCVDAILRSVHYHEKDWFVTIGVGESSSGFMSQHTHFMESLKTEQLARRREENILYYNTLEIERLLIGIEDKDLLRSFYNRTLGKVEMYDEMHHTDMLAFLEQYINMDCSPGQVGKELYIHRNTVNNHVKKIKELLGTEELSVSEKNRIYIAFKIKEIL
ncbi:MAG: PucR family transcriptional regulator ligand-binding domain-containing protein [Lachnospiraceae bacterium]|nr:PucR family transcriptional regulator ligand-binding domain-containing protein [Lachnospiraceae bacterium]